MTFCKLQVLVMETVSGIQLLEILANKIRITFQSCVYFNHFITNCVYDLKQKEEEEEGKKKEIQQLSKIESTF